jgi:hypothetical protein
LILPGFMLLTYSEFFMVVMGFNQWHALIPSLDRAGALRILNPIR